MIVNIFIFIVSFLKIASAEMDQISLIDKLDLKSPISNNRKKLAYSRISEDPFSSLDFDDFLSQLSLDPDDSENSKKSQNDESPDSYIRLSTEPTEADLADLIRVTEKLLQRPGTWKAPIVIFDKPLEEIDKSLEILDDNKSIEKRSRLYRRYPWKRRNSSSDYDYNPEYYLCSPSRREVAKLFTALHGNRQGSMRNLDFCKRQKTIKGIYTNIRYLGRKK